MPLRSAVTLALTLLLTLALLGPTTAAARTPHGRSGDDDGVPTTPFTPPALWQTLCDRSGLAGTPLLSGTNCRWMALDGVWRRYIVEVPSLAAWPADRAWPVVLMLHGFHRTGEKMWQVTDWPRVAQEVGAITIFPTAWRYQLSSGRVGPRWNTWALSDEIDPSVRLDGYPADAPYPTRDVAFMRAILDDVRGQLTLDPAHIHAAGSSNGGKFVNRLAVEMSNVIASVSCSGFCDAPPPEVRVDRPMPVLYEVGARDPLVLGVLAGLIDPDPTRLPLTWEAARPIVWPLVEGHLRAGNLDPKPSRIRERSQQLEVTWRRRATPSRPAARFRLLLLADIGHKYPTAGIPPGVGYAALSWSFFLSTPLR